MTQTQTQIEQHEALLAKHESMLAQMRQDPLIMAAARSSLTAETKSRLAAVVQALDRLHQAEPQKLASVVDKLHQDSAG